MLIFRPMLHAKNVLITGGEHGWEETWSDYSCPESRHVSSRSVQRSMMAPNRHALTLTWKHQHWPRSHGPQRVDHLTREQPAAMEIWHLSLFKWTQTICISALSPTCAKYKYEGTVSASTPSPPEYSARSLWVEASSRSLDGPVAVGVVESAQLWCHLIIYCIHVVSMLN